MAKRNPDKGKKCVYCGADGASETADHVIARKFFPIPFRANLPKVPACKACNGAKADLERYLSVLLPFGGRHTASSEMLGTDVARRLSGNFRLRRELAAGLHHEWNMQNGLLQRRTMLPFDFVKLDALLALITRGLTFYHFGALIPQQYFVAAGSLVREVEPAMEAALAFHTNAQISVSIGDGLFEYTGGQSVDDPFLTIWRYRIYGGVQLSDHELSSENPENIWATSTKSRDHSIFGM